MENEVKETDLRNEKIKFQRKLGGLELKSLIIFDILAAEPVVKKPGDPIDPELVRKVGEVAVGTYSLVNIKDAEPIIKKVYYKSGDYQIEFGSREEYISEEEILYVGSLLGARVDGIHGIPEGVGLIRRREVACNPDYVF